MSILSKDEQRLLTETRASLLTVQADYDARALDLARAVLDDIPACRRAEYRVRWTENAGTNVPVLWVVFDVADLEAPLPLVYQSDAGTMHPAVTVRLATLPSNEPLMGERAAVHIRRSVEHFLLRHGIRVLPPEEAP